MLVPLASFGLALILLIGFLLVYQEAYFFKKLTFLTTHKKDPLLLASVILLFLALALGYVGYLGLIEKIIDAKNLQFLRLHLGITSLILWPIIFRKEMKKYLKTYLQIGSKMRILLFTKRYVNQHKAFLLTSFLLGFIAFAWMAPMASSKVIFSISDAPSHIGYIVQGKMALEEGQFPIRVAPLENFGFRYPGFQFYSQLPYTLGAIIYKFLTPGNPYVAYKILLWLALWVGGIFIYRISLQLTRSQIAAILGGVAYMSAPYFLNNIHARGAFTEAIAQGILPIVLFYVIKTLNQPSSNHIILGAFAWFALGTTHIITFVYTTLFIILLGLVLFINNKYLEWKKSLKSLGISYVLGWLLSLYFLAPVVIESSHLSIRKQINLINPFVTNWMTPLANLLSPTALPSEPTETGTAPTYGLHPAVGWIFLAAFGTIVYYLLANKLVLKKSNESRPWFIPLLSVFGMALFLTWSPIDIWSILPKQLWVTQFTFRFLTHIMWSGALLTALAITLIFRHRLEARHLIIGILIIVIASRPWLPIPRGTLTVEDLLKEPLFRYSGALDYLYRTPLTTLKLYGNSELQLLPGDWIPGYQSWDVFINRPLILEAELYYPLWTNQDKPVLVLSGDVPIDNIQDQANLLVQLDGRTLASVPLTAKDLNVKIPFEKAVTSGQYFGLKFLIEGETKDGKPLYIRMKSIHFQGISPENTILPVDKTKSLCHQQGTNTICNLTVTPETGIVQLPVLYYPGMQRIKINGQKVSAIPSNYYDFYLVSLPLSPGTYTISIKFVGFVWANWISFLTWLGLIGYSLKKIYSQKLSTTPN